MKDKDLNRLPLDDRFVILLHKKIMNKTGSAKRRTKKYYQDQYRKTGIISKPLLLAGQGIMEGRKCSGRRKSPWTIDLFSLPEMDEPSKIIMFGFNRSSIAKSLLLH